MKYGSALMFKVFKLIHQKLENNPDAYEAYSDAIQEICEGHEDLIKPIINDMETTIDKTLLQIRDIQELRAAGKEILGFSENGELIFK